MFLYSWIDHYASGILVFRHSGMMQLWSGSNISFRNYFHRTYQTKIYILNLVVHFKHYSRSISGQQISVIKQGLRLPPDHEYHPTISNLDYNETNINFLPCTSQKQTTAMRHSNSLPLVLSQRDKLIRGYPAIEPSVTNTLWVRMSCGEWSECYTKRVALE